MHAPLQLPHRPLAADIVALPAAIPVPGLGVLPVNSFLVNDRQPMVIDTGVAALQEDFLAALAGVVEPAAIRWIWLTHMDPDHIGGLARLLAAAPQAQVATNFLGAGKLGLMGLAADRIRLVEPGERFSTGRRSFAVVRPPYFDAPETAGLFEPETGVLFSADAFGAVLEASARSAADVAPAALDEGLRAWARIDTPWLGELRRDRFQAGLKAFRGAGAKTVLSSHLPPAADMADALFDLLAAAQDEIARTPAERRLAA